MQIMIVEDEDLIRRGLERVINRIEGVEVIAAADDGESALQWLEACEQLPDLIITDIFMQFVDGLELVAEINRRYPGIRCALLSGHDDFKLAQRAIHLKVCRYLVKPVNEQEISQFLAEIRQEMEQERLSHESNLLAWEQAHMNDKKHVMDKLLLDLLENRLASVKDISDFSGYFPFDLEQVKLAGGIIQIRKSDPGYSQRDLLLYSIAVKQLFAEAVLSDNAGFVILKDSCTLVFGLQNKSLELVEEALLRFSELSSYMLGIPIVFGVGGETKKLIEFREIIGSAYDKLGAVKDYVRLYPEEIVQQLRLSLRMGDKQKACGYAKELIDKIAAISTDADFLLQSFYRVIDSVQELLEELRQTRVEAPRMAGLSSLELIQNMQKWITAVANGMILEGKSPQNQLVAQVIAFMEENYHDSELSLHRLADIGYVHPNYLTQVFRKHTGLSCMQYLARLRMEKAKQLLAQENLKIGQIAERVGYGNQLYFSSYFKKWTGQTPSDYKEGLISANVPANS
ncbi:response regulator transcription factor [Paenibacillus senegalensis]|uniref:response regulator transcription factor n=1 Tax=Paenibacillus senegalensis TaxID=1465766 RepID=UPI0002891ECD|nr:response regulator [Paenibacillus senegalensis]